MFTFISNTCRAIHVFGNFNAEYNNPFIGSLFVNDLQYLKFCQNFDYYITVKPRFDLPNQNSTWAIQNNGVWYKNPVIKIPYPVMYLDDIEIHWIHEDNIETILDKYNRRLARCKNTIPIFILSCSEFLNDHNNSDREYIIKEFVKLENGFFISRNKDELQLSSNIMLYEPWIGTTDERNSSHVYAFHEFEASSAQLSQFIKKRFNL